MKKTPENNDAPVVGETEERTENIAQLSNDPRVVELAEDPRIEEIVRSGGGKKKLEDAILTEGYTPKELVAALQRWRFYNTPDRSSVLTIKVDHVAGI